MIRTLLLIAVTSFVLAVGSLTAAVAIVGGPFWIDENGQVHKGDWHGGRQWRHDESQPDTQRQIPWSGGHRLYIDVPADVTYIQGLKPQLTLSGPADLLGRIEVHDGEITARGFDFDDARLKITLTAPEVNRFQVNGDGSLTIAAYDQTELDLDISGSAKVTAAGRAKQADLHISGSGDVDFSALKLDAAKVDVSGSGDATLAPESEARIDISGSGDVRLLKTPKSEKVDISGAGRVDEPHGG